MKERELQSLLLKLADADVRQLFFEYEGAGDSGCIESIYISKTTISHEDCQDEMYIESFIPDEHEDLYKHFDHETSKAVEKMCYELLLEDVEDWYNNEGGFGWVVIDVPSGKSFIKNNVRYYDLDTYNHRVNVNDKVRRF